MKSLLVLEHIKIENANAISGLTYGFPAISQFLGFTHALSRKLQQAYGLSLNGCAVISHEHQVHSQPLADWSDQVFALTRNPLNKKGETAPFNEEGRMHLDISLLIECEFDADDLPFASEQTAQDIKTLENWFADQVPCMRLAGGTITDIGNITWQEILKASDEKQQQVRRLLIPLLPGFALVSRHDLLQQHHQQRFENNTSANKLDSLLEFVTLRYQYQEDDKKAEDNADDKLNNKAQQSVTKWKQIPKPATGYLVPVAVGYQAIDKLYQPGEVQASRDPSVPFCFVESIYSIGQWLSPHSIKDLNQLLWRHKHQGELYLCDNNYKAPRLDTVEHEESTDEIDNINW